jgi:hypothetical protein
MPDIFQFGLQSFLSRNVGIGFDIDFSSAVRCGAGPLRDGFGVPYL